MTCGRDVIRITTSMLSFILVTPEILVPSVSTRFTRRTTGYISLCRINGMWSKNHLNLINGCYPLTL